MLIFVSCERTTIAKQILKTSLITGSYITWEIHTSPSLCHFLQQNLIIGMYFYLFAINSQNKTVMMNLFLIT